MKTQFLRLELGLFILFLYNVHGANARENIGVSTFFRWHQKNFHGRTKEFFFMKIFTSFSCLEFFLSLLIIFERSP